jgi:hypothetical protein
VPEIEAATYWLGWVNLVKLIAFLLVAIGVVLEFGSEFVGKPLERKIEDARELEIKTLDARAKEAESQLQQLRFPRSLDFDKFKEAVAKMPVPVSYEVLYDANAPDASSLASQIWGILSNAKWPTQQTAGPAPLKAPPPNILPYANMSWTQAAGGGAWGLSIVVHDKPDPGDESSLGSMLVRALVACVKGPPSSATLGYQTSSPVAPGGVRIIVGPKLP